MKNWRPWVERQRKVRRALLEKRLKLLRRDLARTVKRQLRLLGEIERCKHRLADLRGTIRHAGVRNGQNA